MSTDRRYTLEEISRCRYCGKCGTMIFVDDGYYIKCPHCNSEGPHAMTFESAIKAWFEDCQRRPANDTLKVDKIAISTLKKIGNCVRMFATKEGKQEK